MAFVLTGDGVPLADALVAGWLDPSRRWSRNVRERERTLVDSHGFVAEATCRLLFALSSGDLAQGEEAFCGKVVEIGLTTESHGSFAEPGPASRAVRRVRSCRRLGALRRSLSSELVPEDVHLTHTS
jgi:hypothetical protein